MPTEPYAVKGYEIECETIKGIKFYGYMPEEAGVCLEKYAELLDDPTVTRIHVYHGLDCIIDTFA